MSQPEGVSQPTQAFHVKSQPLGELGHAMLVSTKAGESLVFKFLDSTKEAYLGRGPTCQIQAKDRHVSSQHLRIYHDEQLRFFVEELSPAGTFINDQYMRKGEHRALQHGDAITITSQLSPDVTPFASFIFRVTAKMSDGGASDPEHVPGPGTGPGRSVSEAGDLTNFVSEDWVKANWDVSHTLGSGNFSTVKLGVRVKKQGEMQKSGMKCAMKIIDKKKFLQFQSKRGSVLSLSDEAATVRSLKHPNIVTCLDWFQTEVHVYLALELVQGGDLLHCLLDDGCFTESQGLRLFKQICDAVHYLHITMKLVHRDLKPENILLTNKDRDTMIPKLADFGLARKNMKSRDCRTFCGTPQYFAPEVINAFKDPENGYGRQADMWSLGVILYILLSGLPPFEDEGLYQQIVEGRYEFDVPEWTRISEEAKNLVRKLMTVNPRERISIVEALNEPWFRIAEFASPARSMSLPSAGTARLEETDVQEPAAKRRKSDVAMGHSDC